MWTNKDFEENILAYHGLIDRAELQRLQDGFCAVTGTCVYALDARGERQTQVSGNASDIEKIRQGVFPETGKQTVARVAEGSLEDFVIEDTNMPGVKISAIAIRVEGRNILTWVVYGVVSPGGFSTVIDERAFYDALDLLRDVSIAFFSNKLSRVNAEAESMRSRHSESKMSESLGRTEALAESVRLLSSGEAIQNVMGKVLAAIGKSMEVSSVQLFRVYHVTGTMDVAGEWRDEGVAPVFEETDNLPVCSFLKTEKPLIIGSDLMTSYHDNREFLDMHARAAVVFPVLREEKDSLVLCFLQTDRSRVWQMDEIKFISNVAKVLQSVLAGRGQASWSSSCGVIETVLDHVESCIYVRDAANREILLANRAVKEIFDKELRDGIFQTMLDAALPMERREGDYELHHSRTNRWYDLHYATAPWGEGRRAEIYSLYDITDKKAYKGKLNYYQSKKHS
ncbi:MAG: hypothetical protein HDR26_04295 [Lachnospiraceae bacterium]|nr:hypothetical protein [Lachnospiraceae bacterium]